MVNSYGLDDKYFQEKLGIVCRDAKNYSPDEMMNDLIKYALVAAEQAGHTLEIKVKFDASQ